MKILDIYIVKKILSVFFISIILILLIGILIDVSEKIDDFMSPKLTFWKIVGEYYVGFIIYYGSLFIPLFIFISCIWVTSKMSSDTEIVAILASGITYRRFAYPYFLVATIIFIFSLALSHFLVPNANLSRINFENEYLKKSNNTDIRNIYRQVKPNEFIYIPVWNTSKNEAKDGFLYTKFKNNRMIYKMSCNYALWNKDSLKFTLRNYYEKIIFDDFTEKLSSGYKKDTSFNFSVKNLVTDEQESGMKKTTQLYDFIKEEKMRGTENIETHLVEFHKRTSIPASSYILVFIALILSYKKKRGGTGINIAFGIALSFIYIFFMKITNMLAIKENTPALLAVWIPNIIFGILSIFLYKKMVN